MHLVEMKCPVCGHTEVQSVHKTQFVNALYGPHIEVLVRVDTCTACKQEGDFEDESSRPIQQALEISALRSVPAMVERLKEDRNLSPAYIERVTGLQFGSIKRCMDGHYDATVIVALRMVLTYPPILILLEGARTPHGM